MIKYILVFGLSLFFLGGCSSDDDENRTTIYEGFVIQAENQSPVTNATLIFTGMKAVAGIGRLDEVILENGIELGNDGSFRFELQTTRSSIDYFSLNLFRGEIPISIDCAPNSCASLPPRTTIIDLSIVAQIN